MTDGYRQLQHNDGEIVARSKRREDDINDIMRCTMAERSCTVVEVEKREKLGKKKKKKRKNKNPAKSQVYLGRG